MPSPRISRVTERIVFTGRVQGVGFRYTTQSIAKRYEVNGFVRNLPDGRVEIEAEGDRALLTAFVEEVRIGPRYGHVAGMNVEWNVAGGDFRDLDDRLLHARGEHAVFLDGGIAHDPGPAQRLGQRQRHRQRAPDDLDDLLADDHPAHRDQDLLEVHAVDGPHQHALEDQAQRRGVGEREQAGDLITKLPDAAPSPTTLRLRRLIFDKLADLYTVTEDQAAAERLRMSSPCDFHHC